MIQFSKKMIEKVYEIRRLSPPEFKTKIKLTSDTLFEDLEGHYQRHQDAQFRSHIEDLFSLAGKELDYLDVPGTETNGTVINVENGDDFSKNDGEEKPKLRKIIYRGQVTYVA